ncbi:MAG: primosomal replication protein N [Burkholderiaceae bacterium]|nr:primosomal replication protein N [Burkholderiaceae bacterium]
MDGRAARPSTPANRLVLTARIAEIGALRFTPVGLPAIDLRLEHESQSEEAGQPRQVKLALKAVAFGAGAERIARLTLGSAWRWKGFLAVHGKSKYPVFHIQEFQEFQQD